MKVVKVAVEVVTKEAKAVKVLKAVKIDKEIKKLKVVAIKQSVVPFLLEVAQIVKMKKKSKKRLLIKLLNF